MTAAIGVQKALQCRLNVLLGPTVLRTLATLCRAPKAGTVLPSMSTRALQKASNRLLTSVPMDKSAVQGANIRRSVEIGSSQRMSRVTGAIWGSVCNALMELTASPTTLIVNIVTQVMFV